MTFSPDQMEAVVRIPILDDSVQEDTEMFTAMLSTNEPNVTFGSEIPTVTITDDDGKYCHMKYVLA